MMQYPSPFPFLPSRQRGFTLVEMIMVIVITGIIGGIVAVFLQAPIRQYTDVARRADMTDIADTALRRVSRDLRLALPNSVRVTGACGGGGACFIEFLPTGSAGCVAGAPCPAGGRYRVEAASAVANAGCGSLAADVLEAGVAADGCFEVLGAMPVLAASDVVVVYNLGIPGADAYAGNNLATATAPGAAVVNLDAPFLFPFDSPGHRFQVVTTPVTYACDGAGTLWRYWGYAIGANQPNGIDADNQLLGPLGNVLANQSRARLATNVSVCNFAYDGFVVAQRTGLVTMRLGITEDGETVTLYSATHVSNQP